MKTYGALHAVRLSQVRPEGWLKTMLEKERDGFPGHLDEIGYIFAQNDAMALGAVDYLHSHGRKPGKDVLICAFGGGAELRALQKKGEVAVIGALDDTQLAELTADAAQQIAKAPWKPYIALADTAVLTKEGTADA